MLYGKDPKEMFAENFSFSAALGSFIRDNVSLFLLILTVAGVAAVANGTKSILSHRKVGTILLVIMICRAYHAGSTANRIILKDINPEKENDPEQTP